MSLAERPRPSRALRALFAVPVIGWIARDLMMGGRENFYYLLVALVTLWIMAVATWGLPALTLPALVMVPVIMITLVTITVGK
ncbi:MULTISPECIES: hypothetical protein [unclassified Rhodosalinus]|uniref:hypothetical protein n=1 Tax=unclassified Rhodosalinus TaxID=2630183 RepID=UPI0035234204